MPQTYAHQHYGDLVYQQLPEGIRAVIDENRALYDIGLQGPDILFYYHPLWNNPVATLGGEIHGWSGRTYFARAVTALAGMDPAGGGTDAALAYLYGSLCHYALDSICHPYINQYDAMTDGVTHSVIEGDLDRDLIAQAGRNPVMEDQTARFLPSREAAHVIAGFYRGVPERTLYAALRSFVSFHRLLRCPTDGKRNLLYSGLRMIGQYESLRGHITAPVADPLCRESTAHLESLLENAVPYAAGLIAGFPQNLCDDSRLQLDYEGVRHEE